ncbi:hypothetical protein LTR66_006602 [Elasticomyces elasticus]|nr:hypothetical protein LTR66_006602 [Elasticomyces elasticus]
MLSCDELAVSDAAAVQADRPQRAGSGQYVRPPPSSLSASHTPSYRVSIHFYDSLLSQILTGSTDRTIRLFNPAPTTTTPTSPLSPGTGRLIQTYHAHGYEVLDLAVADDNARFVSVGGDKTVFLWDVATAQTIRRYVRTLCAQRWQYTNAMGD